MKYDVILFDLDGTVADSGLGVTNSVKYALEKFGIESGSREELNRFVGPPLTESFMTFCGFDYEKSLLGIEYYREYYKETGIFECSLYDGIKELLVQLKSRGIKLVLATSKPELFAHRVLDFLGVHACFDFIAGASMDEKTRTTKTQVIDYALKMAEINDTSRVLMVGDRKFDVNGAKEFNIKTVGVTFGYGTREELLEAGAVYIADTPLDVLQFIE